MHILISIQHQERNLRSLIQHLKELDQDLLHSTENPFSGDVIYFFVVLILNLIA
jgi:hypothetical protein